MKKGVIVLVLLGILLISPFILAQEQTQTYSGFDRFVDNIKMFFSSGDNKVQLALEIREKELNSAMINVQNQEEEKAIQNLERARNKLLIVQEKVSNEIAGGVQKNVKEVIDKLESQDNLPEEFELYKLEEEKTRLTAELVVEVEGKEGRTLTREIVKNQETGEKEVKIDVGGTEGQTKTWEIKNQIEETNTNMNNWRVEHTYAEGTGPGGESGVIVEGDEEIKTGSAEGDNGLKPEVKTDVASGGGHEDDNEVVNTDEGGLAPGTNKGDLSTDTDEGNDIITNEIEGAGEDGGDCEEGTPGCAA
jgi:hypothetical protein